MVTVPLIGLVLLLALGAGAVAGVLADTRHGSWHIHRGPFLIALAAGGVAVLVVVAVVVLRTGRRLRRDITALETLTGEYAHAALPDPADQATTAGHAAATPAKTWTAEAARIAAAIAGMDRAARAAANEEAQLREGIRRVFVSLARRSQSLLSRQLRLIDALERKAADPDALADLFALDHLTTRMRRQGESLIILSGAVPGRSWRNPVPVIDIIRGAVAEVEDYTRVRVLTPAEEAVHGAAAADVIHLLAELIENATLFSPSSSRVEVRAEAVANGFAIEIDDRGLGIKPDQLADLNAQLAAPPDFDVASADRLGLFVVGKLAARHGIQVSLRSSAYGGATAIVLLPITLMADPGSTAIPRLLADRAALIPPAQRPAGPAPGSADRTVEFAPQALALTGPRPAIGQVPDVPDRAAGLPAEATHMGLPRRVRQANLSPHLRDAAAPDAPPSPTGVTDGQDEDIRTPEQARDVTAALQRGWERGRADSPDRPGPGRDDEEGT